MVAKCGEDGEYLMSFLQAAREHPPIGEVVRGEIMGPMRDQLRSPMSAVAGGEPDSVEFVIDAVLGTVIIRTAMLGEEIDPEGLRRRGHHAPFSASRVADPAAPSYTTRSRPRARSS